jgi:energy-coupling factor transport system permease protein
MGSEDIIDAMDLRAFGVGPRPRLDQLHCRRRDIALIACRAGMVSAAIVLSAWGFGKFWVP